MSTATMSTRTPARTGSAYPVPVAELAERVREQATGLGAWPSLRQVMTTHRVGRPKATAVLDTLRAAGFDPTGPDPTGPDPAKVSTAPRFSGVEFDVESDPEFHRHAGHDLSPRTDCSYCPSPEDEPDDGPSPAEVSGLVSAAVDAPSDTAAARPATPVMAPAGETTGTAPAGTSEAVARAGRWREWPLLVISLGAFVSIWGGWVGLGEMTGFGPIRLLPGIADDFVVNSAITLPLGLEAYAAFALRAWLAPGPRLSARARRFACWSTVGALALGAAGQIAYHLMVAAEITRAPWPITAFVSCLPVLVLGCGAALTHLTRDHLDQHHNGRSRDDAAAPRNGEV